jgi:hypothetical protein
MAQPCHFTSKNGIGLQLRQRLKAQPKSDPSGTPEGVP